MVEEGKTPALNDLLGNWNVAELAEDVYTLRLTVTNQFSSVEVKRRNILVTEAATILNPPILSLPAAGSVANTFTPLLQWRSTPDATSYNIQVAADKTFANVVVDKSDIADTSYTMPSGILEKDNTYYWRVNAIDLAGTSDWSDVWAFKVEIEFPRWDVNEDGVVDISDLVLVGLHFGEDYRTIQAIAAMSEMGSFSGEQANVKMYVKNKIHIQGARLLQVDINIEPVSNLYGCQFDLAFDANVLEVVGVKAGGILAQDGASTYWNISEIDNKTGQIIGATYIRKATPNGAVDASGALATIIFAVKNINLSGKTQLKLTNVKLADAKARFIKAIPEGVKLNWERLLLPETSLLLPNYPNPFNPETWIPYQLAHEAPVTISLYNTKGQLIRTLHFGNRKAGIYVTKERAAYWDGKDSLGQSVASGVYYYSLKAGEFAATRKMVIMK